MSSFYKKARRGEFPIFEDRDLKDPYRRNRGFSNTDGQGWDLNRIGDEETNGSSFGGRFRGTQSPSGFQMRDEYDQQRKTDIPASTHEFLDEKGNRPIGEGATSQFFDSDSPLSFHQKVVENIDGNHADRPFPLGNMNSAVLNMVNSRIHRRHERS